MGTFIFRLCIDNTLCLVTAFDKIEAEHMLEKNKGIISKAEYYFVGVTSGVITISKDGNLTYKISEMSKKRFTDDRKQLLIRYKIDEKGCVSFIDPCCDEIPICLFGKIMEAISNVEQEWNCRIANKVDPLPPNITFEKPTLR